MYIGSLRMQCYELRMNTEMHTRTCVPVSLLLAWREHGVGCVSSLLFGKFPSRRACAAAGVGLVAHARSRTPSSLLGPMTKWELRNGVAVGAKIVTTDLPSWDLQLRSAPPSYALGATTNYNYLHLLLLTRTAFQPLSLYSASFPPQKMEEATPHECEREDPVRWRD